MKNLVYKITQVEDREGNPKWIPQEWVQAKYVLSKVKIGKSAILSWADDEDGQHLRTSKVEGVTIFDNAIILTTMNTVYWFEPLEVNEK